MPDSAVLPLGEKYAYVADFPEALTADVGTRFEVHSEVNNTAPTAVR